MYMLVNNIYTWVSEVKGNLIIMRGDRLKTIREESNLTQDDLAEMLDVGSLQINRYENGKTIPNADVVAKLALALSISSDYLLGLTDDPTPQTLSGGLSTKERAVLAALRRADSLKAIQVIVGKE